MTQIPRRSGASMHRLINFAALAALALTCAAMLPARAQSHLSGSATGTSEPLATPPPLFASVAPNDPNQAHMLRAMAKERNAIRQHQIVDETNQLLDLAKQLKTAVDKSSQDQLSLSVVNTASEIEKLAKSVKEKMRDGQ
jgi:selenocysteine lyase/cysteine desulfurase